MEQIKLTIDGVEVKTTKGKRILEAALDANIYIPNLCALRDIKLPFGSCRLCQVAIEGRQGTITACSEPARDGMVISNDTPAVNELRRSILQIMLARHPHLCLNCHRRKRCLRGDICLRFAEVTEEQCILCSKNGTCELQKVVNFIGIDDFTHPYTSKGLPIEHENPYIIRNNNLCILCGRCVRVCRELLGVEAIDFSRRGAETVITGALDKPLLESGCIFCGSCVEVCPTGALVDRDPSDAEEVRKGHWPPCQHACPAGVDIPGLIRSIESGRIAEAYAMLKESVPLSLVCSRICSRPCESACRRGRLDAAVAIQALERFACEHAEVERNPAAPAARDGKKVAVFGSGAAGLTASYYLARKGYAVTVFDSSTSAGGSLQYERGLPFNILDNEIRNIENLGVEIVLQTRSLPLDKVFHQGFEAIFLTSAPSDEIYGADVRTAANELHLIDSISLTNARKGIYVGGQAVNELKSFIEAVADARRVARSIDMFLGGKGDIGGSISATGEIPRVGLRPDFSRRPRNQEIATGGFTADDALSEVQRCMHCDIRPRVTKLVSSAAIPSDEERFAKSGEKRARRATAKTSAILREGATST